MQFSLTFPSVKVRPTDSAVTEKNVSMVLKYLEIKPQPFQVFKIKPDCTVFNFRVKN